MKGKTEQRNKHGVGKASFQTLRERVLSFPFLGECPVGLLQPDGALGTMGSVLGELLSVLPGVAAIPVGKEGRGSG